MFLSIFFNGVVLTLRGLPSEQLKKIDLSLNNRICWFQTRESEPGLGRSGRRRPFPCYWCKTHQKSSLAFSSFILATWKGSPPASQARFRLPAWPTTVKFTLLFIFQTQFLFISLTKEKFRQLLFMEIHLQPLPLVLSVIKLGH